MTISLKTRNLPLVTAFVVLNYIAFAFVNRLPWQFLQEVDYSKGALLFRNPLIAVATHLGILILCLVIPVNLKYMIIFWRLKNPLPGSRIFSELAVDDQRIDIKDLEGRYGKLPTEPREQKHCGIKFTKKSKTIRLSFLRMDSGYCYVKWECCR